MADQEERRLLPVKLDTYKPLREVVFDALRGRSSMASCARESG